MQRIESVDGCARWKERAMSDELLRCCTERGRRCELGSSGGLHSSVEGQAMLLVHSDVQQSTGVVSGGAGVSLLADSSFLEHATQLSELLV